MIIAVHPTCHPLRKGGMRLGALRLPKDLAAADDQALRRVRARLLAQIAAGVGKPAVTVTARGDGGNSPSAPLTPRTERKL